LLLHDAAPGQIIGLVQQVGGEAVGSGAALHQTLVRAVLKDQRRSAHQCGDRVVAVDLCLPERLRGGVDVVHQVVVELDVVVVRTPVVVACYLLPEGFCAALEALQSRYERLDRRLVGAECAAATFSRSSANSSALAATGAVV